jgi:general secretion pathway protein K
MVLGAITVLTVFLTELQEETSAELSSALAERDTLKAEYLAKSAVNLSRLLIASEPTIRKALPPIPGLVPVQLPIWKFADIALGVFNDSVGMAAFGSFTGTDTAAGKNMGLSGGRFELKIIDEDGKFNVNKSSRSIATHQSVVAGYFATAMQGENIRPLFEERDADDQFSDPLTVCSELIDWADSNAQSPGNEEIFPCDGTGATAGSKGPEINFYQSIETIGYVRKNAAYDSLEEVRLVRGMSKDDVWVNLVEPDANNPESRLITVWGQEKVNINSADPLTLLNLACSYVPDGISEPLCFTPATTNPQETLEHQINFLAKANMMRSIPFFAAPFSKPEDFIRLMKGPQAASGSGARAATASPMASFPSPADIAHSIIFQSPPLVPPIATLPASLKDQLSVKSTRFSIYAEGIVEGYRRETRVRIHAVYDDNPGPPATTSGITPPVLQFPTEFTRVPGGIIYWRVQ